MITLEIRQIPNVFSFNYDFYLEERKGIFEDKFVNHYFFHEIGFETVDRFKQRLMSHLNMKAPYYKQLYETELESKGITFLLNKDLTETFEREHKSLSRAEGSSSGENSGKSSSSSNNKFLDTPQSEVTDLENYLTTASKDEDTSQSTSNDSNSFNNLNDNDSKEKTTLISRGNIGTTSSAELLQKWRDVLINIEEIIIEELEFLMMGVY